MKNGPFTDQHQPSVASNRLTGPTSRRWLLGGLLLLIVCGLSYSTWLYLTDCGAYSNMPSGSIQVMHILSSLTFALVGTLIVLNQPRNRVGLLCLWAAAGLSYSAFDQTYMPCSTAPGSSLPPLPYLKWFSYSFGDFIVLIPIFVLLPLLFPTGQFLSPRWRAVTLAMLAVQFVLRFCMGLLPDFRLDDAYGGVYDLDNPFGLAMLPDWWHPFFRNGSLLVVTTLCLVAIASVVVRFRRSAGEERQQMKWLAYFFATAVLVQIVFFEILGGFFYPPIFETIWYELILLIVFVGFPVTIGVAILKYRLYNIDVIINRTFVYGLLTVLVVGIYALIVSGIGLLFHSANNLAASLVATGFIAVIFQPARSWLQGTANRWLFGERDDPAGVLTRLTSQLEEANGDDSLLETLVNTIASSLKLPYVALWLREDEDDQMFDLAAQTGQQPDHVEVIPLMHQQETIGQLVVAPRSPGEALSPADQQLLAAIARLTATTARTIQLSDAVQEARVRTVSAREEERRRLRRDLHDGLGPVLASQGLKLAAARQLLRDKPEVAERLLDEVMGQSEETVNEVRRLVYGLRPPTLDELGLAGAVREHVEAVSAGTTLQVTVNAPDDLPTIPAAIEVAAFRVVQEAVNNVIRHAQAEHCTLDIYVVNDEHEELHICIEDDGVGLPTEVKNGVGLLSIRERASEVSGRCEFGNREPHGTSVRLVLPFTSDS